MEQQEKEYTKLAALKKHIKARQKEELLSEKGKAKEEETVLIKEIDKKKAIEYARIMGQAKMLLLQQRPLCRRINNALLSSECLRELETQVTFQKIIKTIDEEQDETYVDSIKTAVARYREQEKQEIRKQEEKMKNYRMDLKKQ
ncbi:hypothetical protein EAI_15304 [Harpegnathos saltator]|uniref:Uncharacterized protein n=1 Tax=Harpegnathos saltator TaxID=610380 RepID=E2C308_HARSA|nr:hypothetical protein EAI_15304 [Harpegnathos saltator]